MILLTARFYRPWPVRHAATLGVLTAGLVLIKPHGVMMVAAFSALALLDALTSRRGWATFAARLAAFAAGFLIAGNAVQLILGKAGLNPILFFVGGFYRDVLVTKSVDTASGLGLLAAATMTAAMAMLTGPPITVALASIGRRWRAERKDPGFQLLPRELTFLLTILALLATLAMVVAFTMKVAALGESETKRLWGRYFEFFIPLLWLTAAPFLVDAAGRTRDRAMAAMVTLIGLGVLLVCFAQGVTLFPWDATALTAFFAPNPERQTYMTSFPYRLLASLVIVAAAAATLLRWPIERTWLAAFVGLGLLSTRLDSAVVSRDVLAKDLHAAQVVTDGRPGPTVVIADDNNDGNAAFMSLGGRPSIVTLPSGADIAPATVARAATLVVIGQHRTEAGVWTPLLTGQKLSVLVRAPGVSSPAASASASASVQPAAAEAQSAAPAPEALSPALRELSSGGR